jgi:hypothetical protein
LDCIYKLIENGNSNSKTQHLHEFNSSTNPFKLSHIKNSSIHARSDNYDPSQLINYNSHSNKTERDSYLSEQNEDWKNNCGRITRAIMNDLLANVLSTKHDRVKFNSEFTHAAEDIHRKRDEVLAVMKVVSKRDTGDVKDISISDIGTSQLATDNDDPADTRYIIDCAESVMRIKHYLAQAEKHCKSIALNSPDFLFYEMLPTVEWMESLLFQRKFSNESIEQGDSMFAKYKAHLPPLFTENIGGYYAS